MSESNVSRRGLFQIIGAVPAAAALVGTSAEAQTHDHMHMAPEAQSAEGQPYKRQTFDEHQWETVKVLCDYIIPPDERSGSATQAGVPEFLDDWVAYRTDQSDNENRYYREGHVDEEQRTFGRSDGP